MIEKTPGQRLREAAHSAALTEAQGRAIAAILAVVEIADGGGTPFLPEHAEQLLTSILVRYRTEMARLEASGRPGSQAAERRREQAARRPALEAEAVENSPEVVGLADRRRSHRGPGETPPGA